jgi:energy-coupling factor transporter ATP-binding protein EcfA2
VSFLQLKGIKLNNLSSFADFKNDTDFSKNNLIFGTNGSGKSTLAKLLYLLNKYNQQPSSETEGELKSFLYEHFSKEAKSDIATINLIFSSKELSIVYNKSKDTISFSDSFWTPIKVFNEQYTNRTIGETFQMDLKNNGILIGEPNIKLVKAYETKEDLEKKLNNMILEAKNIVETTVRNFRDITGSTLDIDSIICLTNLLADSCDYELDPSLIHKRKKLGFGRPTSALSKLDAQQVKIRFNLETVEHRCLERVSPPSIDDETAELLRNYTDFFSKGIEIFQSKDTNICPFCFRDWPSADSQISNYKAYLESTFNKKRDEIKNTISKLLEYKKQIESQIEIVENTYKVVSIEAQKYDIDTKNWLPLKYDNEQHDKIISLLKKKYDDMKQSISIITELETLQKSHIDIINNNNQIIAQIMDEIATISSRRKMLNKKLAGHFAKKMWLEYSSIREKINEMNNLIEENNNLINKLEKESPPQDTVNTIFNSLLSYIGLEEYFIDSNKKLNLRLDKNYDISSEGRRISSAQRKILSLCYFFAEIISEVDTISKLRHYILIFDDPVDSSDYIYFHSITSVIEKSEQILTRILEKEVKFGQFFVLTHNSILYNRLSCKWSNKCKSIKKENGVTVFCKAEKMINNYNEYIKAICKYYRNPVSQKSRMIYIGNIIRRVLEILASFDSLETNNFENMLDGMGKTRLALLANHLSHDSFSKVLDPFSSPDEIRKACQELLEVIQDRHPNQFNTIKSKFEIDLSS